MMLFGELGIAVIVFILGVILGWQITTARWSKMVSDYMHKYNDRYAELLERTQKLETALEAYDPNNPLLDNVA